MLTARVMASLHESEAISSKFSAGEASEADPLFARRSRIRSTQNWQPSRRGHMPAAGEHISIMFICLLLLERRGHLLPEGFKVSAASTCSRVNSRVTTSTHRQAKMHMAHCLR